jgi:hypothetical protein
MDVELYDETRVIPQNSEKTLSLPLLQAGLNDGYSLSYRLVLHGDIVLHVRRAENVVIADGQEEIVIESPEFNPGSSFLVLKNDGPETVSLRRDRGSDLVEYIRPVRGFDRYTLIASYAGDPYIQPGGSRLYDALRQGENLFLIETDQYKAVLFAAGPVLPGYMYIFSFNGTAAQLIDRRPLTRVGEPAWIRTLPDISVPALLAAGGAGAYALSPPEYAIQAASPAAGGGLLWAGFTGQHQDFAPLVRNEGPEGTLRWQLEPSRRADRRSAYYLALAPGEGGLWLAAGGADSGVNDASGYKAYLRCFRDPGATETAAAAAPMAEWELGPDDFAEPCGAVKSAIWDAPGRRWIVTGEILNQEPPRAYTACIDGGGKILSIDTGFRGFSFSKIIAAAGGGYYLIGEEQKPDGRSYAAALGYSAPGDLRWRAPEQPPPESYYQDGVLNEDEGTLVLAGTMNGKDPYGSGGTPFIEALNLAGGNREWIKALAEPVFAEFNLAAGIVRAPGYGYVLSLAGIDGGAYRAPFALARVNARGFYTLP